MEEIQVKKVIIVTGAAGFIGSCMVQYLNDCGYYNLVLVDDFGVEEKRHNWEGKQFSQIVERYNLFDWLEMHEPEVDFIFHLGARTDTAEFDYAVHQELNIDYSIDVWNYCTANNVPLIYASSAATYGNGDLGYDDSKQNLELLTPLNPYGISKNEFDKWALKQAATPPFWAALKFFNVYGPNEYHKGRMASVIYHAYHQIKKTGSVRLFKSYKPGFEDGKQLRDFIYVKDVISVMFWMMERYNSDGAILQSGIYNLGTGIARTFEELVEATFAGLDREPQIEYVEMPEDIRDKYQYFTQANMGKLKAAGYQQPFYSLEAGIDDYVRHYLTADKLY